MSKKHDTPTAGAAVAADHPAGDKPRIMSDRVWLVLARRAYDEPLRQVGTVEADDIELARVYARSIYDEFAWVEMAVVPRDALVTVIAS
ncbi:MAG: hypothetical protein ACXWQR_21445 [Ktedonobacterales bacterium]